MKRETIQDYLEKSGMGQQQADTLSRILDEMATKSDIVALDQKIDHRFSLLGQRITDLEQRIDEQFIAFKSEMRTDWDQFRSEMRSDQKLFKSDIRGELKDMEARLSWRFFGGVLFLAAVITVLNTFVGQ